MGIQLSLSILLCLFSCLLVVDTGQVPHPPTPTHGLIHLACASQ